MYKILIVDNYDSFTYNIYGLIKQLGIYQIEVIRNNCLNLKQAGEYDSIILSPGPGLPKDAGIMPALIKTYAPAKKILGICLGHQAIGEAFGANLIQSAQKVHGKASNIKIVDNNEKIFSSLENTFHAGRYHSWVVSKSDFPKCLQITAESENGEIMALTHRQFAIKGVQFHPESILTAAGKVIFANWIKL